MPITTLTQLDAAHAEIRAGFKLLNASALSTENTALKAEIVKLKAEIVTLKAEIIRLQAIIDAGTGEPPPPPPPPPPPGPTGWPSASTTGVPAGTTLTTHTGSHTFATTGAVIENKRFTQMPIVTGQNITFRNCRIEHGDRYGINADSARNCKAERCTIVGRGLSGQSASGVLGHVSLISCDISGFSIAANLKGDGGVCTANYIHDLGYGGPEPHYDGFAFMGGGFNWQLKDNLVIMPGNNGTAALFVSPHNGWGDCRNITFDHNRCLGSPSYPIYIEKRSDGTVPTGCVVTNNELARGDYGYMAFQNATVTHSGNKDATSGASVD